MPWNWQSASYATTMPTRAAIAAYEKQMRERNAEAMEGTRENTELFHAPDGLERLVAFFSSVQPA